MKKATEPIEYCGRCGSPQKITKTWIENIKTFDGGTSKLTFSQIACTNKECQVAFDKKMAEERRKKEEMKAKNEAYTKNKANGTNGTNNRGFAVKKPTLK